MNRSDSVRAFLDSPAPIQLLTWLVLIVVLEHGSLFEPPVWDSAMGVFPAAIYLDETNFDIRGLLDEPGWLEGGPNVHSLSLVTWLIALIMRMTGSPLATFLSAHVLTFLGFAWALTLFSRALASCNVPPRITVAATAFILVTPAILVQVGFMYTDAVVLILGVAVWSRWIENKPIQALLICAVALMVKLTALPIALSLFLASLASARQLGRRTSATVLVGLVAAILFNQLLPRMLGATTPKGDAAGETTPLLESTFARLAAVPDLTLVLTISAVAILVYVRHEFMNDPRFRRLAAGAWDMTESGRLIAFTMPPFFIAGLIAQVASGSLLLPRYLLPAMPFAVAGLALLSPVLGRERFMFGALLVGCGLGLANYNGALYPAEHKRFSIVERSHAYRDFLTVQRRSIQMLSQRDPGLPAFVTREIGYMTSHPMMGYVEGPIPNVHHIYRSPYLEWKLAEFPDEFLLVKSNSWHGGKKMKELITDAIANESYRLLRTDIELEGFESQIVWIKKQSPDVHE